MSNIAPPTPSAAADTSSALISSQLYNAEEIITKVFPDNSRPVVRTWRRWVKLGLIPCTRIGRRVYFDYPRVVAALRRLETA